MYLNALKITPRMVNPQKVIVIFAIHLITSLVGLAQCPEINASSITSNFCIGNETTDLYFSEYIEADNAKCLEIYNGTGQSVNLYLEDYSLKVYLDGATTPTSIDLDNVIINNKNTLTICDLASNQEFLEKSDLSKDLLYDGNDAVALFHGNELIDQIGVIGCDPGATWKSGAGQRMHDAKLIRIPTKGVGAKGTYSNCKFTPLTTEWSIYSVDENTLGVHHSLLSNDCCTLCPSQLFNLNINKGTNLPQGGSIDWNYSSDPNFDPYFDGTYFISSIIPAVNCAPASGKVVFNEIMVSPLNNDDDTDNPTTGEWLELLGPAGTDIGCYLISDGDWVIRIPPNTILDQDGLFVIGFSAVSEKSIDLDLESCNCTFSNDQNKILTLDNTGEYILLFNGNDYSDALKYGNPAFNNSFPFGDIVAGGNIPTPSITGCVSNNFKLLTPNWAFTQLLPPAGHSYEREPDYFGNFIAEEGGSKGSCNVDLDNAVYPLVATYGFLDDLCNEHIYIKGKINPSYGDCDESSLASTEALEVCIACPKIDIHTTLMEDESIQVNGTTYDVNNPKGQETNVSTGDICNTTYDIDLQFRSAPVCPEFTVYNATAGTNCNDGCELCPNDAIEITLEGINLPQGTVDWYLGTTPNFDPYAGDGDYISSSNINVRTNEVTPCNPCPQLIALMVDACNQKPTIKESNNEFMIIASGGGIPLAGDIQIDLATQNNQNGPQNLDINLGPNPCTFLNTPEPLLIQSLRSSMNCNNVNIIPAGPNTPIPAAALVVVFMSSNVSISYDFDGLCANGETIYILQNSCTRTNGAFSNSSSNGTRTYKVFIDGCSCNSSISYNTSQVTNIANLQNGSYAYIDINGNLKIEKNVSCSAPPVETIPIPPLPSDIDPFFYFVPYELCSDDGVQNYYIKGIINPIYDGCAEVVTQTFSFTVDCTEPDLKTATLCVGSDLYNLKGIEDPNYTGGWSSSEVITESGGEFFFDPVAVGTYTFQYSPISNCGDTATTTIEVVNGTPTMLKDLTICVSESEVNLNDLILTDPLPDGEWSGTQVDNVNDLFDPSGLDGQEIEVTFTPDGTSGCSTEAIAKITINAQDTAILTDYAMCENDPILDLTTLIDATSTLTSGLFNGTGIDELNSTFDPTGLDGDYEITFVPTGDCVRPNSLIITVTPTQKPAINLNTSICSSANPLDLNSLSDPNHTTGIWTFNGSAVTTFDPDGKAPGDYEVIFESDEDCFQPVTATITIVDEIEISLLENEFCTHETTPYDLTLLQDPSYPTGTWSGDHVINGSEFDLDGLAPGKYTIYFQSDEPCVKLGETTIEIFQTDTPILEVPASICDDLSIIDLTTFNDPNYIDGSWSGTNVNNDMFDPSGLTAGTYTLTFKSNEPCIQENSIDIEILEETEPALVKPNDICNSAMPLDLTAYVDVNYPNGTWSGNGVSGTMFHWDNLHQHKPSNLVASLNYKYH